MAEKDYAFIKDNVVINIAVFDSPTQELLDLFIQDHSIDLIIEAKENAAIGGTYDGFDFWLPKPFPSWIKDNSTNSWISPVPMPSDQECYIWDEEILNWKISITAE